MKALISSSQQNTLQDLPLFRSAYPSINRGELRFFSQTSGFPSFPTDASCISTIYYNHPPNIFDEVYIGSSVRLFQNAWGRAFLRMAMRLVNTQGKLIVSAFGDREAKTHGMWSVASLSDLFGEPHAVCGEKKRPVVVFCKTEVSEMLESVLDWYIPNAASMHVFDILQRANRLVAHQERTDDTMLQFIYDSAERIIGGSRKKTAGLETDTLKPDETAVDQTSTDETSRSSFPEVGEVAWYGGKTSVSLEPEIARAVKSHAYYVGGISYKSALLKHIIKAYLPDQRDLRAVDFGGGYGLLMAELLLDDDSNVNTAVVRDYDTGNLVFASKMFRHLHEQLKDRFYFSLGRSEDFEFEEKFDVVSFVGSLLYVPKEEQKATLKRCWDAMSPRGILVVHENIKNESYKADYDLMFTPEEIDGMLREFGKVRYFMSTSVRELSADKVGDRSVFRVVQKS